MKKENKAHTKFDAYKTSTRVVRQVDMLLYSLVKPNHTLVKASSKSFTDQIWDNPYIDKDAMERRVKKYEKEWSKLFNNQKKRFKKAMRQAQWKDSPDWFNFFAKKELDEIEREEVVKQVFNEEEIAELYDRLFVQYEMEHWFKETKEKVASKIWVKVDTKTEVVPTRAVESYRNFGLHLSKSVSDNETRKVQDIIIYWMEWGKSTRDIAKEIINKFDYYSTKEANRIARTETIRASTKWSMAAYQDLWVTHYEILPSLDACPICLQVADWNPYKVEDNAGQAPIHPNCRCTVIPVLDNLQWYNDDLSQYDNAFDDERWHKFDLIDSHYDYDSSVWKDYWLSIREDKAMRLYTAQYYYWVNDWLRLWNMWESYQILDKYVQSWLSKLPKVSDTVYRWVNSNFNLKLFEKWWEFVDKWYLSTSLDLDTAKTYANWNWTLITIKWKWWRDISWLSLVRWEQEVLFSKNTRFKVIDVIRKEDSWNNFNEVVLEEILSKSRLDDSKINAQLQRQEKSRHKYLYGVK